MGEYDIKNKELNLQKEMLNLHRIQNKIEISEKEHQIDIQKMLISVEETKRGHKNIISMYKSEMDEQLKRISVLESELKDIKELKTDK